MPPGQIFMSSDVFDYQIILRTFRIFVHFCLFFVENVTFFHFLLTFSITFYISLSFENMSRWLTFSMNDFHIFLPFRLIRGSLKNDVTVLEEGCQIFNNKSTRAQAIKSVTMGRGCQKMTKIEWCICGCSLIENNTQLNRKILSTKK